MEVDTSTPEKLCNGTTETVKDDPGEIDNDQSKVQVMKNSLKNGKVNGIHKESNDKEESMEDDCQNGDVKNGDSKAIDNDSDERSNDSLKSSSKESDTNDDSKMDIDNDNSQSVDDKSDKADDKDVNSVEKENCMDKNDSKDENVSQDKEKNKNSAIENQSSEQNDSEKENITRVDDVNSSTETVTDGDNSKDKEDIESTVKDGEKEENDVKEDSEKHKKDKDANDSTGSETNKSDKKGNKDSEKDKNAKEAVDLTAEKKDEKKTPSKSSKISAALKPSPISAQLRPMASLLFDLGMDLARQQVYKDLIRIQMKKQSMDKLDDKETRQLDKLKEAYDDLVSKNEPYVVDKSVKCDQCPFTSDLDSTLENHKEYGHAKDNGLLKCSYCNEHFKASHPFLVHMDQRHKKKGRVLARHSFFVCPFCPFEHNSKAAFNKHILRCERVFNLARNLEPTPADCDIPIKLPKPPATNVSIAKPRASSAAAHAVAKKVITTKPQSSNAQPPQVKPPNKSPAQLSSSQARSQVTVTPPSVPGAQVVQVGNQWYTMVNVNGQRFLTPLQAQIPSPQPNKPANVQHPSPKTNQKQIPKTSSKPKVTVSQQNNNKSSKNKDKGGTFEICEICGGFVKDRESLRIHFYWAHKVDIHKDVFNKGQPNLACDKCNFRTWTVQGLTRHKNMAHKEVVKGKDKGRMPFYCMLCRPTPELLHTETFWLHMAAKHSVGPDTIFSHPHCVVCGVPNIGVPRALETHMLNVHSQLFSQELLELARKLISSKVQTHSSPSNESRRQHHPQQSSYPCEPCGVVLRTQHEYNYHIEHKHTFKCSRCTNKFSSRDILLKHFHDQHKDEKDHCPLCNDIIPIGRPLVRHMRSKHMKECSVQVRRIPAKEFKKRIGSYRDYYGTPVKTPTKSRKRSFACDPSPGSVIVLEDTPTKKSKTSSTKMGVSESRMKSKTLKEKILVDGEEILVEMQQEEDEESPQKKQNETPETDNNLSKQDDLKNDKKQDTDNQMDRSIESDTKE